MLHENKTLLGDAEYKHLCLYCPHGTSWVFLDVSTLNFLCSFISSHFWWKITADFPPSRSPLAKSKYTPPFPFSKTRDHWEDSHKAFFWFWYFLSQLSWVLAKKTLRYDLTFQPVKKQLKWVWFPLHAITAWTCIIYLLTELYYTYTFTPVQRFWVISCRALLAMFVATPVDKWFLVLERIYRQVPTRSASRPLAFISSNISPMLSGITQPCTRPLQ